MSLARNFIFQFLFFILLCFFNICIALPEDNEKPMTIIADSFLFNNKTGEDIYEGNVKIDQGTTHLTADRLITKKNEQHKIISAIAYGEKKLAEYITLPKKGDLLFHAKANVITFYPLTFTVILEKNVIITQGQNRFHGPMIIYNIKKQTVATPASDKGHATIIIEPKQLKL